MEGNNTETLQHLILNWESEKSRHLFVVVNETNRWETMQVIINEVMQDAGTYSISSPINQNVHVPESISRIVWYNFNPQPPWKSTGKGDDHAWPLEDLYKLFRFGNVGPRSMRCNSNGNLLTLPRPVPILFVTTCSLGTLFDRYFEPLAVISYLPWALGNAHQIRMMDIEQAPAEEMTE